MKTRMEEFSTARFATHPDGRIAARVCTGPHANLYPWRCSDIPGRSDYAMADDGFIPLSESLPSTVTDEMTEAVRRVWLRSALIADMDLPEAYARAVVTAALSAAPAPTTDEAHDIDWQAVAERREADAETVTRALDEAREFAALWKETARHQLGKIADRDDAHASCEWERLEAEARAEKAEENATYWENTSRAQTGALERAQARLEKAEEERDHWKREADGANGDLTHLRGMTAREHLDAAWSAAHVPADGRIPAEADYIERHVSGGIVGPRRFQLSRHDKGAQVERRLLDPPPPKQPEGAEAITSAVWGMEIPNEAGAAGVQIAESLAKHGYKIVRVTEDGGGDETPDVCPHIGGPGGDCGCPL